MPANAPVGEWLYSSPLTLLVHGSSKSVVVRIGGKPLGGGRIEAALQQLGAGGERGPLLFPTTRILPSDAPIGVWQYSSTLTVITDSAGTSGSGARSASTGGDALMGPELPGTP